MKFKRVTLMLLASSMVFLSCASKNSAKLLVGKWQFMKFFTDYEVPRELQQEIDQYAQINKGLTVRFSPNGEFESDQPGGPDQNNKIADYKVMGEKVVIERDTIHIVQVDQSFLVLYKDKTSPKIMFRRLNNTGTEPGRR